MTLIKGRAWIFGDHINTESILSTGRERDLESARAHVLEHYDVDFAKHVQPSDFIVAGRNFGASSGRQAGRVLKAVGLGAVICESAGRVFYRNTWNMALPVFQCPGIRNKVEKGDELEVDVELETIKLVKTGEVFNAEPTPPILREICSSGGMLEWIKSRRKLYATLEQV